MQFYIPNSKLFVYKENDLRYVEALFHSLQSMKREAIVRAASKMSNLQDFLNLLNKVKMSELGEKGHPFTMSQLNYFINPKRGTACYNTFTIPKKSGGVRTISAPTKMLKSMLTYTNRILQAFYKAPDCVTGFVPAKSVVDNAERHIGMNYVFNTDLKDFFPSIPQARVWGALKSCPFGFPEKIASAIAGLCCIEVLGNVPPRMNGEKKTEPKEPIVKHVLPQGSPCSPTLTNIVCHNLDWKLSGLARRFHLKYSRYADDITFSGNQNVFKEDGEFMPEFRRIVAEQNFTLNEKKTRLQKRGERQEVTGLVVSDRVNVSRDYVRDLDNLLYIWEKHGIHAAFTKFMQRYTPKQDLGGRNPDMASVVQGRLMYLRMVKGEDSQVWRRLQKRFNRLLDRKDKTTGTDIVYLHTYSIEDFERAMGCRIDYYLDLPKFELDQEASKILGPHFSLNGKEYYVRLSRYARTRLQHVLESGSEEELTKFKQRFKIAYCRQSTDSIVILEGESPDESKVLDKELQKRREYLESERFWMIFRGMKTTKAAPVELAPEDIFSLEDLPEDNIVIKEDAPEGTGGLSTEDTLQKLVNSNFDLNTLEQWEKIKTSS